MFRRTRNVKRGIFRKKIGIVHLVLKDKIGFFAEEKSFIENKVMPPPPFTLFKLGNALMQLAKDKRVKGLVIHISKLSFDGMADAYELREILKRFKASGKPIWITTHYISFIQYYFASVADRIYMIAGSEFGVTGISTSINFYKQVLDKYGIQAETVQVSPFKSAGNFLVYDEMPEEQAEMMNWIIGSMFDSIVEGIAESRGRSIEEVKKMIDSGPFTDIEVLEGKWIDGIMQGEGIEEQIEKEFGETTITDYYNAMSLVPIKGVGKRKIAVIPAIGGIEDGESSNNPLPIPFIGGKNIGDITIVQTIRKVIKQKKKYKAALFFVDSPGGSAVSSEAMLTELKKLSKVLPTYIYFHNVAASGGYYIACIGRPIYSAPVTITGSIGVIGLKFILEKFYAKQKIKRYTFKKGENADIGGADRPWTEEEKEKMKKGINRVYDLFIEHVAESRSISEEEIKKIAGGRVWTGVQGVEHKLVDHIESFFGVLKSINDELGQELSPVIISSKVKKNIPPIFENTAIQTEITKMSGKTMLIPYIDISKIN